MSLTILAFLKSNMDRFIEDGVINLSPKFLILKSNMDRFIDNMQLLQVHSIFILKSNMDRFIAVG